MPGTKDEEHVHNQGIVVFIWKEVLEYWNWTLGQNYHKVYYQKKHTCNKSSKSLAASFFITDALELNRRIVEVPNVGICRNLMELSITNSRNLEHANREFNSWIRSPPTA
jgi:hypothetical protein